ncbi:glutamyl-tRNA reductase [Chondrinema litorale]|uniref:glutamyl-tRNA reductase n=1 Tax=Chondrinema litorale TaxID=2994555 RepID=UPI0025427A33|nr:glutamyl-tRNA reductase [Chondrinema litorale]UZR96225.1 glutamyl-tRNA reductase [Chondrinema litorale]
MQSQFKAISISYKNAPLSIREQISLDEKECGSLMRKILEITSVSEALVLSTCNRTEVYYSSQEDQSKTLIQLLCVERGIANSDEIIPYFQVVNDQNEAAIHLFNVSIGLESQVVGDLQITNQVKRAYQLSADLQAAGPFLHRLMHTIFFTNKKVVQETAFRDGAASVSYAAVELVEELTFDKADPKVLVVGVGEIGSDVVRNLQNTHIKDVTIVNRTISKAVTLAQECDYKVAPFENLWEEAEKADVIISSVAGHEPFFTKERVTNLNLLTYKIFIDLSVPRSVEKNVEEIPGAIVHNVDDINNRASQALERRKASIPLVREIIAQSVEEFNEWSKEMIFSPTIQKLKNALEQIRQEELSRYMKQLNEKETEKVEMITRNMMNKIIKLPVLQLKAACKRGEAETLVDLLNDLFNLEANAEQAEK